MKKKVTILSIQNMEWDDILKQMPKGKSDIYFSQWYYMMEKDAGHGEPVMFIYTDNTNHHALYPFLKRKIDNTDFFDIESAYGYGGPLVDTDDEIFIQKFENEFLFYCQTTNIIAEFVRFHPLISNEHIFKQNIDVIHNRETVWLDLNLSEQEIWMNEISGSNRNIIRKCEKNGLKVFESHDYEMFRSIYNETMDKVDAENYYYFNDEYYYMLNRNPNCILLLVEYKERVIAGAVFIKYGEYFHYHLSGSRKDALKYAPNNILLWEAIKYGKKLGCAKMHFGGGLTDSEKDSLFQFKQRFSSEKANYYIGKRIHNMDVYQQLISDWEKKKNRKAELLLQYREK